MVIEVLRNGTLLALRLAWLSYHLALAAHFFLKKVVFLSEFVIFLLYFEMVLDLLL